MPAPFPSQTSCLSDGSLNISNVGSTASRTGPPGKESSFFCAHTSNHGLRMHNKLGVRVGDDYIPFKAFIRNLGLGENFPPSSDEDGTRSPPALPNPYLDLMG